MSHVIDDATSAMHDTYDETTPMLDNIVPLGEFLDDQLVSVLGTGVPRLACLRPMAWLRRRPGMA